MEAEESQNTSADSIQQFLAVLRHNILDAVVSIYPSDKNNEGYKPRNMVSISTLLNELKEEEDDHLPLPELL